METNGEPHVHVWGSQDYDRAEAYVSSRLRATGRKLEVRDETDRTSVSWLHRTRQHTLLVLAWCIEHMPAHLQLQWCARYSPGGSRRWPLPSLISLRGSSDTSSDSPLSGVSTLSAATHSAAQPASVSRPTQASCEEQLEGSLSQLLRRCLYSHFLRFWIKPISTIRDDIMMLGPLMGHTRLVLHPISVWWSWSHTTMSYTFMKPTISRTL